MYVEKVETWTRALGPNEIAERQAKRSEKELLAVVALRDVETFSGSSVNIDVDRVTLRAALKLDLPPQVKDRIRANLVAILMRRDYNIDRNLSLDEYYEFAELVLQDAKAALSKAESEQESESETASETENETVPTAPASVTKEELENYVQLVKELTRLREVSSSISTVFWSRGCETRCSSQRFRPMNWARPWNCSASGIRPSSFTSARLKSEKTMFFVAGSWPRRGKSCKFNHFGKRRHCRRSA